MAYMLALKTDWQQDDSWAALPLSEAEDLNTDVLVYIISRQADWQEEEDKEEEGDRDGEPNHNHLCGQVPYIPYGCIFFHHVVVGKLFHTSTLVELSLQNHNIEPGPGNV